MEHYIDLITGPAGAMVILVLAVMGVLKGWWIPRWQYKELEKDRDRWEKVALRGLDIADRSTDIATKDK